MPNIMTTNATVQCIHAGPGVTAPGSLHWNAAGGFVLVEGNRGVLTCPSPVNCTGYTLHSMGLNSTELDGKKVILVTDFNLTDTGLPLIVTEVNDLVDSSTAAPISAAGLTPPLLDTTVPVVTAIPPAVVFNSTTQQPASMIITFNLAAAFPLRWVLTLISDPTGTSRDLTSGVPGASVSPAGGSWPNPSQTVTLTLTLAFLTALAPGAHHFYLTAANQRGASGFNLATLTVS
jgi:hypothetical protein